MRNGKLTLTIFVSLFCAVGCGGPVADAEAAADDICACEDMECANAVQKAFEGKYGEEDLEGLSDDDKGKILAQVLKTAECMKELE